MVVLVTDKQTRIEAIVKQVMGFVYNSDITAIFDVQNRLTALLKDGTVMYCIGHSTATSTTRLTKEDTHTFLAIDLQPIRKGVTKAEIIDALGNVGWNKRYNKLIKRLETEGFAKEEL